MIRSFEKLASGVAIAANAAGTFVVILLIVVVNYDIVARGLFNKPFLGAVEVVQFSMVLIVFLQLPDVIRVGRLTRSDGFLGMMHRRRPAGGRFLARAIDLFSATFMVIVAWAIWPEFLEMWDTQDYFGVPGVFTAPWWPVNGLRLKKWAACAAHFVIHTLTQTGDAAPHQESGS